MKTMLLPFVLTLSTAILPARAATVDLTTFTLTTGTNSSASANANLLSLFGTATASGNVARLGSFQWDFTAGDFYIPGLLDDYSFFAIRNGGGTLADVASVQPAGGSAGTTGWRTYSFSNPYTGPISFSVANRFNDEEFPSNLQIRNLLTTAVSPVPEPDMTAMLLAGAALLATTVKRRRARQAAH